MLAESVEITASDRGRLWACDVYATYLRSHDVIPREWPMSETDAQGITAELTPVTDKVLNRRLTSIVATAARAQWKELVGARRVSGLMLSPVRRPVLAMAIPEEVHSDRPTRVLGSAP